MAEASGEAAVRLESVRFAYPGGIPLIGNLSLEVGRGERVCVLGRNGSGKSTLLKLMAGLLPPDSGQILIDGVSIKEERNYSTIRRAIGFAFQNPEDQILSTIVETDVAFALENFGTEQQQMRQKVATSLQAFRLEGLRQRHPLTLSAGEKQRTALAAMMITEPEILLLDEPTSFLDYGGRRLLKDEIFNRDGLTIIAASQYADEVRWYDRVVFLERGGVAFSGTRDEFMETEYWQQMSLPSLSNTFAGVSISADRPNAETSALRLNNVSFGYVADKSVIEHANIEIPGGGITAVMGDSGCGKTTLALLLAGLVTPNSGTVSLAGKAANGEELAKQVSVLFQFPETGFFAESTLEEVAFGIKSLQLDERSVANKVRTALEQVGLDFNHYAARSPFQLSAGEQRRVAVASVLVMERPIVVFDEVTLGLDWEGRNGMSRLFKELASVGKIIILMTHDVGFAAEVANYIVLMDQGKIVWQGAIDSATMPEEFLADHFGVKSLAC